MILTESEIPPRIREWHAVYEMAAGKEPLDCYMIEQWRAFLSYGDPKFTHQDLRSVVKLIRSEMDGKFLRGRLRFNNLIGDVKRFSDDLRSVREKQRPRQPLIQTVKTGQTERIIASPGTQENNADLAAVAKGWIEKMRIAAG